MTPRVEATRGADAWTIVAAETADAEAILELQQLAYQVAARRYNDWSIPALVETLESVRRFIEDRVVLKALLGDRLIGSVRAAEKDGVCEIGRLIVHPDVQGRGIGSALLHAIEGRFPAAAAFELFTGARSESNLRLYRRHGYIEVGTRPFSAALSLVYLRKPGPAAAPPS